MTIYNTPASATPAKAHFSMPSLLAIAAAIGSFFVGPGFGLMLAVVAILLGAVGLMLAFAPSVRGGMVSMISVVAGLLGILGAILRFIF
jgi:hypothetical protein